MSKIEACNFKCFENKSRDQILAMLTGFKKRKGKKKSNNKTYQTFNDRWNNGNWKHMFGDIVFSLIKRVVGLRDKDINELCDTFAKLFGIHLDHQVDYFNKRDACSQ